MEQVRAAYDEDPEREWERLVRGAQARLEFLITLHALERALPPASASQHLLDAGGGPGRYTLALAQRGYPITLLDLSPALLALARRRVAEAEAHTQRRVVALHEGSITDLSRFPNGHFSAVLCLGGPLSHLVDAAARQQALAELARVVQGSGPLFISVLNRFGAYRSSVQWPDCYTQFFPHLPTTGRATIGAGAAPAYFFTPDEFVATLEQAGLTVSRLYGCNGLGAHLPEDHLLALMADPLRWHAWREQLLATADHPSIVGVSNHLLAVAHR